MPGLLESEFEPSFSSWKATPGPGTADSLLKAVDPVISSAIQTYGAGDQSPILRSRARSLTLQAMKTYDPNRAKLRTHLMTQLQGLRRVRAQQGQIISIPEQVQLDQNHLREAHARMRDWLGRDPSDAELTDETGFSLKRLAHVRKAAGGLSESQAQPIDPETGDYNQPTIVSPDDDSGWNQFVYMSLDPRDQVIMEHSMGLHGKKILSSKAIAAKIGISPAAISQRASRIQGTLDQRQSLGVL